MAGDGLGWRKGGVGGDLGVDGGSGGDDGDGGVDVGRGGDGYGGGNSVDDESGIGSRSEGDVRCTGGGGGGVMSVKRVGEGWKSCWCKETGNGSMGI